MWFNCLMKKNELMMAVIIAIAVCGGLLTSCENETNKASKYEQVDASGYVKQCKTFLANCLGYPAEDAIDSCSWIEDATEVTTCARNAIKHLFECFNEEVACDGQYTTEDQDALTACQDVYNEEAKACYQ